MHFFVSIALRVLATGLLAVGTAACGSHPQVAATRREDRALGVDSAAIRVATQRLTEHGQNGFSIDDAKRTHDWFTPELFALLVRDMSDTNRVGYLNWDPFTAAQDAVGHFRFDEAMRVGDTTRVRFSREGFEQKRESVTLAMRLIDGRWRIANFLYPDKVACHRDLAVGLIRYAQPPGAKRGEQECQ